jgi:hypothetical protein
MFLFLVACAPSPETQLAAELETENVNTFPAVKLSPLTSCYLFFASSYKLADANSYNNYLE